MNAEEDRDVSNQNDPPDALEKYDIPAITDMTRIRSLIHPLRVRLYEELFARGPSTATELANILGDTQANCSWHLRHLHKNGFIEEAPERKGRARPWQIVPQIFNIDFPKDGATDEDSPAAELSRTEITDSMLNVHLDSMRRWIAARRSADPEWRAASRASLTLGYLTKEELDELSNALHKVTDEHILARADRFDPAQRPKDARAVRVVAWATPGPGPSDPNPKTPPESTDETEENQ